VPGMATVSAMVFGMLATDVPADRRSATLNLVYLPLYAAGIVGPALGAAVIGLGGLPAPFLLGAAVFLGGAIVIATRRSAPRPVTAVRGSASLDP
jgi:peptidoglycan/LPS O-acetylase OafA/YrhL